MGDRADLLRHDITMQTLVDDLIGLIEREDLRQIDLVGHSFGGGPITGVADRVPERIRRLVYLDAIVLDDGESMFASFPEEEVRARKLAAQLATGGLAVPVPAELPACWGLDARMETWVRQRLTPHPLATYTTSMRLRAPIGNSLPRTYIACVRPLHPGLAQYRDRIRHSPGWDWVDLDAPHEAMITNPDEVTALLLGS
jgi:pimeloyl-ACP methyl ester carboxylesterase